MAETDNPVPKRVLVKLLAVVVPCLLAPFILAQQISLFLWTRLVPYLVFGIEETRHQGIAVTVDERSYVTFSNGVTIHGWRWVPLELLGLVMWLVIFAILSFLLLQIAAGVMQRFDPAVSHGILSLWRKKRDA